MRSRCYLATLTATLALVAGVTVRADGWVEVPVWLETSSPAVTPGLGVTYSSATLPEWEDVTVTAGAYRQVIVAPTSATTLALLKDTTAPIVTFCIDLPQENEPGSPAAQFMLADPATAPRPNGFVMNDPYVGNVYNYASGMGVTRKGWLELLAGQYWLTGAGDYLDVGGATPDLHYAAFQVAVWEIVFEGGETPVPTAWNVSAGDFSIADGGNGTAVRAEANAILDDVEGKINDLSANRQWLGALVHGTYQDLLVRTWVPTPEPSSMVLAGLGLLGLLSRRRKRA